MSIQLMKAYHTINSSSKRDFKCFYCEEIGNIWYKGFKYPDLIDTQPVNKLKYHSVSLWRWTGNISGFK